MRDVLPEGWREVALGEVCEYVRGVTYGKTDAKDKPAEGFVPLLRATNIEDGRLILSDFVYVPSSKVKPVQMLKSGDLVMAASSGSIQVVGKSAPVPSSFIGTFGAFCAALRPNGATDESFLNFFVASPKVREEWSAAARGTNINNLKREPVLGTQIPLPPLPEQQRIVEILEEQFSRLDAALASIRTVREKALAFRRSLLHSAFTGELTGGTEGWREVALKDAAEVIMGQSPPSSAYNEVGTGKPFFQGKAEFGDRYPTVRKWTTEGTKEAVTGDILMSVRAPVGPTNIANVDCIIGRGLAAIRAGSLTNQTYLLWVLRSIETDIAAKGVGTTFASISGAELRGTQLPLPPLPEQQRIVEILEEQFSRLDNALQIADQLEARIASERRSLLHSAFTGALTAQWRKNQ